MTIGIICTVMLGLIALHQAVMARVYRRVAVKVIAESKVMRATISAEIAAASDSVARHDVNGCVAAMRRAGEAATRGP